jgi:hypothetical protein
MPDILAGGGGSGAVPIRRFKEMGDGTFAEVVYALVPGGTGGGTGVDVVAIKDGVDAERKLVVDSQGRIAIIGTVTIANPTASPETGLAKEATLAALLTELGQKLEPGQAVALDAATLAALETISAVVSGTVAVSNFPASQPVTGPLTDAQLRAAAVPVSGFPATQAVSGTVAVSNPTPAPVATAGVTATAAAGAAVTLTLPAPGAGLFPPHRQPRGHRLQHRSPDGHGDAGPRYNHEPARRSCRHVAERRSGGRDRPVLASDRRTAQGDSGGHGHHRRLPRHRQRHLAGDRHLLHRMRGG